jgi:hypothetical protein
MQLHKCGEWAKQTINQDRSSVLVQNVLSNPKFVLYGATLICLTAWLLMRGAQFLRRPSLDTPSTPQLEKATSSIFKAPTRKPGGLYARFEKHLKLPRLLCNSMGTYAIQAAYCSSISQLGCSHNEAESISTI